MPRRRKATAKQVTNDQYDEYLSVRMELAYSEQALEADYQARQSVMEAMEASGKTRAKEALGKMIVLAMQERRIDKEEYDDGSRITASRGERRSLDRDLLTEELERREIDPDDIVAIIEAATAVTEFQQVRVYFPRADRGGSDTRLRR